MEGADREQDRGPDQASFDLGAGLPPLAAYVERHVTDEWGPRRTPQVRAAYEHYLLDASGLQREDLTERENQVLTWLCGWDDYTIEPIGWLLARASGLTVPDGAEE